MIILAEIRHALIALLCFAKFLQAQRCTLELLLNTKKFKYASITMEPNPFQSSFQKVGPLETKSEEPETIRERLEFVVS